MPERPAVQAVERPRLAGGDAQGAHQVPQRRGPACARWGGVKAPTGSASEGWPSLAAGQRIGLRVCQLFCLPYATERTEGGTTKTAQSMF